MSEDDKWDTENFRADVKSSPGLMSNQWDGEDEDEDIKDSWDDPEEEQDEKKKDDSKEDNSSIRAVQVKKPKKLISKIEEKEKKLQEELEKKLQEKNELETPEEIHSEKLRQQKLQEEADLEVARQLLGVSIKSEVRELETTEDFDKYCEEIIRQIGNATKNQNFAGFVDNLVQQLCVHLSATELKKIHTWVGNLQIEKHRMEQGTKSKKKGKGKAKLNVDNDTDIYSSYNEDVYDDFM